MSEPEEEPGVPGGRTVRRGRRAGVAVFAAVVVSLAVGGVVVGPRLKSPAQVVADAAPPEASVVTAVAEERRLTEPVILRGRVKPGPSVPLRPPAAAVGEASVVTSVPVRKGDRLREGQVLLVRSGEPMFVVRMPFALYRDILPGMTGPDVAEIQRVLRRLGYRTGARGAYDEVTQAAVDRLYRDRGHRAPRSAAPDTGGGGDGSDGGDGGGEPDPGGREPSPQADAPASGPVLARSAVLRVDRTGRRVTRVRVKVGSVLSDARSPLVELDGGDPYLETLATAEQVDLLREGLRAQVTDDVAGRRAEAEIVSVGRSVVNGGQGEESGFRIRLEFTGAPLEPAEDRTVRVDVGAADGSAEVLAVPVTAVFSRPDGGTQVTVLGPGGRRTDVTVTAGKMAGGWVEITDAVPDGVLGPGTSVVVSESNLGGTGGRG
ncbi:peptidoglycan-binding domain-containing protein [Thermomonospora amylolytica]|uniref:peptidoglycan-binding domain-containing protein n=1 Tax=Thermomonospora amylolytica TaxID=1411117 RepID=UPI000E6C55BF|nr:peptidoglycan-binding domain-containing protein [Thermomonospora amylolytica]